MSALPQKVNSWIKQRLDEFRGKGIENWPDLIALLILVIGIAGEIPGPIPYPPISWWLIKLHQDLSTDFIAIGLTVLIIDKANRLVTRNEEKKRIILQMGSPDFAFAIEAVRILRDKGYLTDKSLRRANLHNANLSEAKRRAPIDIMASFNSADLHKADLSMANLSEANLMNVIFSSANLSRSDMSKAKLYIANLSDANLSWANLFGADLTGANLSKANIRLANLGGADLRGVKNCTPEQLEKASSLVGAYMPDGTIHE